MPTGYTSMILEGCTFEEYALACARNFGALVSMRDEPSGTPIPEKFEPSKYQSEQLIKAKNGFHELNDLTKIGWQKLLDETYSKQLDDFYKSKSKNSEDKAKYQSMLALAKAYKSPSPEHLQYAQFLITQIESSIDFDCSYWDNKSEPVKPTLSDFIHHSIASAQKDIVFYNKSMVEELDRNDKRNEWIKQLRESIINVNA